MEEDKIYCCSDLEVQREMLSMISSKKRLKQKRYFSRAPTQVRIGL